MKIGEFDPLDRKYWGPVDPDFSVARNRKIIEDSIKKYDKERDRKMKVFTDKLGERVEAVSTYLTGTGGVSKSRTVERYFGKTYLAHLRGEDLRNQLIKQRLMTIKTPTEAFKVKASQQELKKELIEEKGINIQKKRKHGKVK